MPRTALDVCNLAIDRIGGERIDGINEDTPAGSYCAVEYPQCRDWLLSKYRWVFAAGIKPLDRQATTPDDCPRAYAFNPPGDLVGAIFAYRTAADPRQSMPVNAEQINGYIAADEPVVYVEYTRRVPEANWPIWFVELTRLTFAAGMASSVGQNQTLAQSLYQLAFGSPAEGGEGGLYSQARNEDSRNAPRRQAFPTWDDGPLAAVRNNYGYGWGGSPFVIPPGAMGPISFIDFSED